MNFNKKKCLELMKESNKLRQKGTFLWDYDKAKYDELSQYFILLSDDIFWNSRKKYLKILELFVRKNITVDEFMEEFGQLRRSNLNALKMLKENLESEMDLQLNSQSVGLTKIIGSIYSYIDLFDPDITLDMNLKHPDLIGYGISEEFLRVTIKDNFLPRIGEYCKKS